MRRGLFIVETRFGALFAWGVCGISRCMRVPLCSLRYSLVTCVRRDSIGLKAHHRSPRIPVAIDERQPVRFYRVIAPRVDLVHIRPFWQDEVLPWWESLLAYLGRMFKCETAYISGRVEHLQVR